MDIDKHVLQLNAIFRDKAQYRRLVAHTGDDAQQLLDALQVLIDCPEISKKTRSSICSAMVDLSKNSGLHPQCLFIQNVRRLGEHPVAAGGFGDVWKGVLGNSRLKQQPVCLKVPRAYESTKVDRVLKEYMREAIVWKQLNHPNILPFLGIFHFEESKQRLCLVSPWMRNGNLVEFLKVHTEADRTVLAYDVALGLAHLHEHDIIHGDLKAVNVLITPEGRACITDFGLARVADRSIIMNTNPSSHSGGTVRWTAPELFMGSQRTSQESDIYAYGCLCYEVFTGLIPYHELPNDASVVFHVMVLRNQPSRLGVWDVSDEIWSLMEWCWQLIPSSRPSAAAISTALLGSRNQNLPIERVSDWDQSLFTSLRENVALPAAPASCLDIVLSRLDPEMSRSVSTPPMPVRFEAARGDIQRAATAEEAWSAHPSYDQSWLPGWDPSPVPQPMVMSPVLDSPAPEFLSTYASTQQIYASYEWTDHAPQYHADSESSPEVWDDGTRTARWDDFQSRSRPYTPSLISSTPSNSSNDSTPPATPTLVARGLKTLGRKLNKDAIAFVPRYSPRTRKVSLKRPDGSDLDLEIYRARKVSPREGEKSPGMSFQVVGRI